jgi:hypothetical protein
VPELREGGYVQHDAIPYRGLPARPRRLGVGLVDAHTGAVVGIHGTGNDQGKVCTADNPCEADTTGKGTVHIRQRYAQAAIPTCFTAGSEIDLFRPCCTLPKPAA